MNASPKFSWAWHHIPEVQQCYKRGDLAIGTLDSWLVYKFSGGNLHVTDYSNARYGWNWRIPKFLKHVYLPFETNHRSATGVYDPYQLAWSNVVKFCLFPYSMPPWSVFPKVVPTAGDFGTTEESLFGHTIPINGTLGPFLSLPHS
jgi:glycerol kinase